MRAQQIEQIHPLLAPLKPSLHSSLDLLDDHGESDRFDMVLKLLPTLNATYLQFDTALINDLLGVFRCDGLTEEHQILPSYWSEWQNARTYYLMHNTGVVGVRELTFIRIRRDAGDCPRLDDLVWMGHEVAHHLLLLQAQTINELFTPAWENYLAEYLTSTQNSRGDALAKAEERAVWMEQYWHPASKASNWTHELIIDTLCLWVFGPAYLWAFVQEHIEEPQIFEAHHLDMHPPRRLRAEAMKAAAEELGWPEAADMDPLLQAWEPAPADASAANKYRAFRRPYLVEGTREVAIALARQLGIPRLNADEWLDIRPESALSSDITARDLILAAWKLRDTDCPLDELEAWEERVVSSTLSALAEDE